MTIQLYCPQFEWKLTFIGSQMIKEYVFNFFALLLSILGKMVLQDFQQHCKGSLSVNSELQHSCGYFIINHFYCFFSFLACILVGFFLLANKKNMY